MASQENSVHPLAFIADEKIYDIRAVLEHERNYQAVELFDELTNPNNIKTRLTPEGEVLAYQLWEIMAGIRHLVYKEGYARGPEALNNAAVKRLSRVRRETDTEGQSEPLRIDSDKQDLLVYRTAIALRALASVQGRKPLIEAQSETYVEDSEVDSEPGILQEIPEGFNPKQRDQLLGLLRARFLKRQPEKVAEQYFDFAEPVPVRKIPLTPKTPLDDLMNLLAYFEKYPDLVERQDALKAAKSNVLEKLIRRLITENPVAIKKASEFLTLRYFEAILDQMPDTLSEGKIGGKSLGMLLAYAALEQDTPDFDKKFLAERSGWDRRDIDLKDGSFEENNSTFIGTYVFNELLTSGANPGLAEATSLKDYYKGDLPAEKVHAQIAEAMRVAVFPPHLERQFKLLFRKLHGRPIIVRSSSELEDRLGASFAGQYDSVELGNSGDFEEDFKKFKTAILQVYASVFTPMVMDYRRRMGLLQDEEEMGVLIQELNGAEKGGYFYPDLSIVAMSYATQSIGFNAERGAMRVAAGLGRAVVDRGEGRYTMFDKPTATYEGQKPQAMVSVLRLADGNVVELQGEEMTADFKVCSVGVSQANETRRGLTFKCVTENKQLVRRIEYIVQKLKHQLGYEVDCEFTAQYDRTTYSWRIRLVQCRPQNIPENLVPSRAPGEVPDSHRLVEWEGAVNGTSLKNVSKILYIDPAIFDDCTGQQRRAWVRAYVSAINKQMKKRDYLIVAPRSWGSKDEASGLQVDFHEFSNAAGILEVGGSPTFGTHFLQVLFDAHIAYSHCPDNKFEMEFFRTARHAASDNIPPIENMVEDVPPELAAKFARHIKLIDVDTAAQMAGEDESLATNTRGVGRPMVLHMAQDPTTDKGLGNKRPACLYLAPKGLHMPISVKELTKEIS